MSRDSRRDWSEVAPSAIPTKNQTPELERFLVMLQDVGPPRRILDLGCGNGAVSARLSERGFDVVGVDINPRALEQAASAAPTARFHRCDVAAPDGLGLDGPGFDAVVCQLVISLVGGVDDRKRLLTNAFDALVPGGWLYLSASGVSSELNPAYRALYEKDFPETNERHTYFSRDADGRVLYATHHFEVDELEALLATAGFTDVATSKKRESSSRRPGEAAYFLYLFARKPSGGQRMC